MRVELFLKFPDRSTMLQVASALSGVPDVQNPNVDGWLETETDIFYWNLDEIGLVYEPTGNTIETEFGPQPEMAPIDGWHVNGLWNGPEETIPETLNQFRIYPETPSRRFG